MILYKIVMIESSNNGQKKGRQNLLKRLVRYRLFIPIERSLGSSVEVARGTSLGLGVGLTPTVGIQLTIVGFIWLVLRYVLRLRVDLISACAWTWVSNPVTMFPMYFIFYLTGELLLFRSDMLDYQQFQDLLFSLGGLDNFSWGVLWENFSKLWDIFIIPILVGSLLWSLGGFVGGYFLGGYLFVKVKTARHIRAKKRRARWYSK